MADRPILFSAPMVRALLDGRKTQTRRILKPQPERTSNGSWHVQWQVGGGSIHAADATDADLAAEMWEGLRIHAGDRLWVREAWRPVHSADPSHGAKYRADLERDQTVWKPGIHMFRWASRLTLTVTDVRVQRLQDISKDDAVEEGLIKLPATGRWVVNRGDQYFGAASFDPRSTYAQLWDGINGDGAWAANPFVAAYSFEIHRHNIDQARGAA